MITSPQYVDVEESMFIQFSAVDPDNDPLTYSATNLPQGATFNFPTGLFSWTPNSNQEGLAYTITFKVQDQEGFFDQENIMINVLEAEPEFQAEPSISPDGENPTQSNNSNSNEDTSNNAIAMGAYMPVVTSNDEVKQDNNEASYNNLSQENIADQQNSSDDELLLESDMLATEYSQENNFASTGYYQPVKQTAILASNLQSKLGVTAPLSISQQDATLTQETTIAEPGEAQPKDTAKKASDVTILTTSIFSIMAAGLSIKAILKLLIAMKLF